MRVAGFALAALAALAGCSLMGYSDIDAPRCQVDSDCLPVSAWKGIHPDCLKYRCDEGACVQRRDGEEVHDGYDNDCDGLIDEPSIDENGAVSQTIAPSGFKTLEGVSETARVAYAADPIVGAVAAWADPTADPDEGWFAHLDSESPVGDRMGYLSDETTGSDSTILPTDLQRGCRASRGGTTVGGPGLCGMSEIAVGITAEAVLHERRAVFVAAVNGVGCAEGQLRIGFFELGGNPDVILRGPRRRSNSYLGVDLSEDGACSEAGSATGVARLAMAVVEGAGRSPRALVAWLTDASGRDECGGEPASVRVIGAFLETNPTFDGGFGWVTTTNEAGSQHLGSTLGGGRPGVAALEGSGAFVGYGDEGGDLALHFVPVLDDPPEYDGVTCCGEDDRLDECEDIELVCDEENDRSGLETRSIEGIVDFEPIDPGFDGPVDHVVLSVGTVDETSVELGAAWLERCGADGASVVFRRVVFRAHGGRPTEIEEVGPIERLAGPTAGQERLGPPTLAYQEAGFVLEGFSRGDSTAAERDLGGWYVAWAEGREGAGRVAARRVLELDGFALDDEESIDLSLSDSQPSGDARDPFLFAAEAAPSFIYRLDRDGRLVVGEVQR